MTILVTVRAEKDMTENVRQRSGEARTSLPDSFLTEMAKGEWLSVEHEMREALPGFEPVRRTAKYEVGRHGFDMVIFSYSMDFTQKSDSAKPTSAAAFHPEDFSRSSADSAS